MRLVAVQSEELDLALFDCWIREDHDSAVLLVSEPDALDGAQGELSTVVHFDERRNRSSLAERDPDGSDAHGDRLDHEPAVGGVARPDDADPAACRKVCVEVVLLHRVEHRHIATLCGQLLEFGRRHVVIDRPR